MCKVLLAVWGSQVLTSIREKGLSGKTDRRWLSLVLLSSLREKLMGWPLGWWKLKPIWRIVVSSTHDLALPREVDLNMVPSWL